MERIRPVALAHPGVVERPSQGSPTFFTADGRRGRTFASVHDEREWYEGRLCLWAAAPQRTPGGAGQRSPGALLRPALRRSPRLGRPAAGPSRGGLERGRGVAKTPTHTSWTGEARERRLPHLRRPRQRHPRQREPTTSGRLAKIGRVVEGNSVSFAVKHLDAHKERAADSLRERHPYVRACLLGRSVGRQPKRPSAT